MILATPLRPLLPALAVLVLTAGLAAAQVMPDPVGVSIVRSGHGKVRLTITPGATGTPHGFTVCWMKAADFAALGSKWPDQRPAGEGWGDFTGTGTLNTWGATTRSFQLGAGEALDVEIGDLRDETGVSGVTGVELDSGEHYVFNVYPLGANGPDPVVHGALSATLSATTSYQGQNCTYTQGYWKTHPAEWPLSGLTLGTVPYTEAQLLQILAQPVQGNGLVSLAHQLIAATLNLAQGTDPSAASAAIASANTLIGSLVVPPVGTGSLPTGATTAETQSLDDFNNGVTGPGHCVPTQSFSETWGRLKALYR